MIYLYSFTADLTRPSLGSAAGVEDGQTPHFPGTSCNSKARTLEECLAVLRDPQVSCRSRREAFGAMFLETIFPRVFLQRGARFLTDEEVMTLVASRSILNYKLEAVLESPERGVAIRREMLLPKLPDHSALALLPYKDYDYSKVLPTFGKRSK